MEKISVFICAYNEKSTIKNVIYSADNNKGFNEIIVVVDGLTDNYKI